MAWSRTSSPIWSDYGDWRGINKQPTLPQDERVLIPFPLKWLLFEVAVFN
jgi:hypothetical protein